MYDPSSLLPMSKAQTGVIGLDTILAGGLAQGGLYLIEGTAGVGKTVMANQMAFACAQRGDNVIYLTLLAESHGKLLHHLRHFTFFDPAHVTHRLFYISGYKELLDSGLNGLLELLASLIAKYIPSLMIIDGFRSAGDFFSTELELAKFVHELNTFVTAAGCTTVLLSPPDATHAQPEQVLVDGLIELSQIKKGLQTLRCLEVHKVRGSAYLPGKHFFNVSNQGIEVFPRLESMALNEQGPLHADGRCAFGLSLLDERLSGGLRLHSLNRIVGPSGVGKTLLGLKFLEEGARLGEAGLMWSSRDSERELLLKARDAGLILEGYVDCHQLLLKRHTFGETIADEMAIKLRDTIKQYAIKRVFIDSLQGFDQGLVLPERRLVFFRALSTHLQSWGVTVLFSVTLLGHDAETLDPTEDIDVATSQTLVLQWDGPATVKHRSVFVLNHGDHEATHDELLISSHGLDVKRRERRPEVRDPWSLARRHHSLVHSSVSRARESALRVFRRS